MTHKSTRLIFKVVIPHINSDINELMMKVGPHYRISDARQEIEKRWNGSDRIVAVFDKHIEICERYEEMILELHKGRVPLFRDAEICIDRLAAKITDFKYKQYSRHNCIVVTIFLHPLTSFHE